MTSIDWIATVLAVITSVVVAQLFPAVSGLWAILVFFVLAGLYGGILRIMRGDATK